MNHKADPSAENDQTNVETHVVKHPKINKDTVQMKPDKEPAKCLAQPFKVCELSSTR